MNILDKINNVEDLKKIDTKEKQQLATEIRKMIIDIVSKNGGHLASNLGVVELTIALHSIYNSPEDKIVWDVGHQTYVHKILTGRKDKMNTLRMMDGIAGFPKISESEHDCFNTGHSSTSISVALGMARARDLLNKNNKVIAVIGDGALTGGMAQEALNDAGASKTNITVILNDNEMSISKNVGGVSMFLTKLRTKKLYTRTNIITKKVIGRIPVIGEKTVTLIQRIKRSIKQVFISKMYFEDIGFTYLGPVDGHDIEKLESILKVSNTINGPVLVHVITKKGNGYKPAEKDPDKFHSTGPFNKENGKKIKKAEKDYSKVFGDKLIKLANKDKKIVAVTAAMKDGTGLTEFAKKFPDRFFDCGIAEQHAVGLIAGMAKEGLKPVMPIYSSFLQRAYDQVIHDICIQKLPVTICIDRAGVVGNDGETHQGIFDLSFLSSIPNINILAPKDFKELEEMLEFSVNLNEPVVIRYPRGGESITKFESCAKIEKGKSEIIKDGKDVTILAIGNKVARAKEVAEILEKENISVKILNTRFLKPLDEKEILKSINDTKMFVTIEDNLNKGGLYSSTVELLNEKGLSNKKVIPCGYPDEFIKHGTVNQIEKLYGLDAKSIAEKILHVYGGTYE